MDNEKKSQDLLVWLNRGTGKNRVFFGTTKKQKTML
jgi:hypothetical protein